MTGRNSRKGVEEYDIMRNENRGKYEKVEKSGREEQEKTRENIDKRRPGIKLGNYGKK